MPRVAGLGRVSIIDPMQWSLFCRVVDNFGDVGVAWRLAADLAARGERVRLVIDDASALAWMAPTGAAGVDVVQWDDGEAPGSDAWVETFGCGWPAASAIRLAAMREPPVCIDLEHLSAEDFVARSHGLPLPRFNDAGEPLPSWVFYPGFDASTGGLLREQALLERRAAFGDGRAWLATRGIERHAGERCVSIFCYANNALDAMLDALADRPTLLLLAPGAATTQAMALLDKNGRRGPLRAIVLPCLSQTDFDHLLWSTDLNFVRGEDSFARAMWPGVPFVWQAYPQGDGAHRAKIEAFLAAFLSGAAEGLAANVAEVFRRWNGSSPLLDPTSPLRLPDASAWAVHCERWRARLAEQPGLTTALLGFVTSKR